MISYELEVRKLHCCLILIIVIYPVGILVVHTEYWTVDWANQYSQCSARCIDDPGYGAVRVATTTRCSGSASTATGKIDLRDYNGSSSPSLYYFVRQYTSLFPVLPKPKLAFVPRQLMLLHHLLLTIIATSKHSSSWIPQLKSLNRREYGSNIKVQLPNSLVANF